MRFAAIVIGAVSIAEARYKSGAVTGSEKFTMNLKKKIMENPDFQLRKNTS